MLDEKPGDEYCSVKCWPKNIRRQQSAYSRMDLRWVSSNMSIKLTLVKHIKVTLYAEREVLKTWLTDKQLFVMNTVYK